MVRNLGVVLLAMILGNLIIFLGEMLNGLFFPFPENIDFNDKAALKVMMDQMPLGAYLGVELSYFFASVIAGAVVGQLATSRWRLRAIIVGSLFTLANFMNLAQLPQPIWFAVLTTLTFLPASLLGARLRRPTLV